MNEPAYAELEFQARRDLAARVIADPGSSDEHVRAATAVLTAVAAPRTLRDAERAMAGLSAERAAEIRDALEALYGTGARADFAEFSHAEACCALALRACAADPALREQLIAELRR